MSKKYILVAFTICIIGLSCGKEDQHTTDNLNKGITGEWNWLKSQGGITGSDIQTPDISGIERIVKFHENDTVEIFENGTLVHKTDYFLSREESMLMNDTFDFVTINYTFKISNPDSVVTLPMRYMIIELSDNLRLDEDVFDGYGHWYRRIK